MKITRIDTLRLDEFPSLVHVLVHTDEGLVGLGETFFFADAVEAHVHTVAGYLLGRGPGDDRAARAHAARLRRHGGQRRRDARRLGDRHRAVGSLRPGGRTAAPPGPRRRLPRLDPHLQHVCRLPLRPRRERPGGDELGPAGADPEGPYEDLDAFLNRADDLARDLLVQGITGMKIWPFDPYAEASLGHDISDAPTSTARSSRSGRSARRSARRST